MIGSITAPSVGASAKAKVPPWTPVILAVAPSHVAVNSKAESLGSPKLIWISSITVQSKSKTSTLYVPDVADETVKNESVDPVIISPSRNHW